MKLLYCESCEDVFKLRRGEMRQCACGLVKGRYINNVEAEVSRNAISLAIGNGSLQNAIHEMLHNQRLTNDRANRDEYYETGKGRISHAWVRPNTGVGNPHCKLIEE